jgi:hypothetical protein
MARGGKRPGAGAKKGVPQPRSLEKLELLAQQRAFYAQHLRALWQARLDLALGCQHLMGKSAMAHSHESPIPTRCWQC